MWEWLWWTGLITFSLILIESVFVFDFFLVLAIEIIGLGTLVWVRFRRFPPFLAAYERRLASSATPRKQKFAEPEATIRERGGRRRAAPPALTPQDRPMPIEIRRFGVGHRRPDGPPGSIGLTGQVIHSDARGVVTELAFARGARIEPHANPNTTWFIVIEGGGWVGVGDERARVAAGEAVLWPADIPHAAWTEHSEMRAFVVEFAGADDARSRSSRPGPRRRRRRGRRSARGDGQLAPTDRAGRPRTGAGRAG